MICFYMQLRLSNLYSATLDDDASTNARCRREQQTHPSKRDRQAVGHPRSAELGSCEVLP